VAESLQEQVDRVSEKVDAVLRDGGTKRRVGEYFNPANAYAGRFFNSLLPNEPDQITQVDLAALVFLDIPYRRKQAQLLLERRRTITDRLEGIPTNPICGPARSRTSVGTVPDGSCGITFERSPGCGVRES
jgi:uncharacterized protein DUF6308